MKEWLCIRFFGPALMKALTCSRLFLQVCFESVSCWLKFYYSPYNSLQNDFSEMWRQIWHLLCAQHLSHNALMQVSSERQLRLRCHRRSLVFIVCFFIEVFHIVICMIDDCEVVEGRLVSVLYSIFCNRYSPIP